MFVLFSFSFYGLIHFMYFLKKMYIYIQLIYRQIEIVANFDDE
jgi:hypothetical protein